VLIIKFFTKKLHFVWITLLLSSVLTACGTSSAAEAGSSDVERANYNGKKIVWVDSYHQGYEWSDGLEAGLKDVLDDSGVELKVIRMDTKRNSDEAFGQEAATQAKAEIETFKPDVVIATDDNAQKFLIEPYYKDTDLPVIFAGVNWDASVYGYPARNVTGMVEVELPVQLVNHLKKYTQGEKIGYLSVDNETQRKIVRIYEDRFFDDQMQVIWANSWEEFKEGFLKLQDQTDMVIISNNAGIDDWNQAEASAFFTENTKIPTGSIYSWMAPYSFMVLGIVPEEHGLWAGETALRVLDGVSVSDIPTTENKKENLILNLDIAESLDVAFTPSILKNAEVYSPEE
jgi:ABC-type uncharacterized transport system substrate-binding protein